MSSLNKTEAHFSGLNVHNKGKNILTMTPNGKYSLKTDSILNHSFKNLQNVSVNNSEYKTIEGNLSILTENGNIKLTNGNEEVLYNIKSQLENPILDDEIDDEILFIDIETLNNLRNNSLLIESLKNKICLYGNKGIDNITHNDFKIISDKNIILQALKKIKINTMGLLSINTEKMITSSEEDITLISNLGDINLGGDGIDNIALKIKNNKDIILGKELENNSHKFLINIPDNSIEYNGINISGNKTKPELKLNQKDIELSLSLGGTNQNNYFFARIESNTINILDNFEFSIDDLGNTIEWVNGNKNKIINVIDKHKVEIDELRTDKLINKGYIIRDNCGSLKTKSNSNLYLGTNDLDIINISKNGRVGINTKNIGASLHITNNYGKTFNIRNDKEKEYLKYKYIQLQNTNYLILCNSFLDNKYSLECFLFSIENSLLKHIILKEESFEEIEFDIILNPKNKNMLIITICFFNDSAVFITETSYYDSNLKRRKGLTKRIINTDIEKSSYPLITPIKNINCYGHILLYRDSNPEECYNLYIYSNTNEILFQEVLGFNGIISKLLFLNNQIIYCDNKLNTINLIFENNKFIKTDSEQKDLGIVFDVLIYEEQLLTSYLKDGNLYLGKKILENNLNIDKINLVICDNEPKLFCDNFKLYDSNNTLLEDKIEGSNIKYFPLKNSNNEYIKSLLIWETRDYNSNTILFRDLHSRTNLLKIENKMNNIEIKDNGDIIFQDLIEFSKEKKTTEIKNNLIISQLKNNPLEEKGQQGQINHYDNELYIYLGNKWKKIKLEVV
jgi:hypothetical protein